jgi:FAD/FMN-containing dehydrogenase
MGGQIAEENSLHFDMRSFNRLVWLNPARQAVRVQTGMTWRELQNLIDLHDLSAKIMQSYANFTIGGALSVNAHGRYVGLGPVINSVRRIQIVSASGVLTEASRTENPEIFRGAIGGYGALGVVTEVELDLVPNVRMERHIKRLSVDEYRNFFAMDVLADPGAVMHNADFDLPAFDKLTAVTWLKTDKPVTVVERLTPAGASDVLEALGVWSLSHVPDASLIRRTLVEPVEYAGRPVVWRNHEASIDVASLGRLATKQGVYALQEYFIPNVNFSNFAVQMSRILSANDVQALNVSVRHSPADQDSIMSWCRREVFSFVLYYYQHRSQEAQKKAGDWTRELIEAALSLGGTYYLPYQLHASHGQFNRAYPAVAQLFSVKSKFDPRGQFQNKLWDKYGPMAAP